VYVVRGSNAEAHVAKTLSPQDRATGVQFVAPAEYCVLTEWNAARFENYRPAVISSSVSCPDCANGLKAKKTTRRESVSQEAAKTTHASAASCSAAMAMGPQLVRGFFNCVPT
jgi:hypothetical protein